MRPVFGTRHRINMNKKEEKMKKHQLKKSMRSAKLLLTATGYTLLLAAASGLVTPAVADELFTVAYEKEDVSLEEETVLVRLILQVTNISGQKVQDVVVSVAGMNSITYDNHSILVGNLTEAQTKGILEEFTVPTVSTDVEKPMGHPVVWIVEYTDLNGNRNEVEAESMDIDEHLNLTSKNRRGSK